MRNFRDSDWCSWGVLTGLDRSFSCPSLVLFTQSWLRCVYPREEAMYGSNIQNCGVVLHLSSWMIHNGLLLMKACNTKCWYAFTTSSVSGPVRLNVDSHRDSLKLTLTVAKSSYFCNYHIKISHFQHMSAVQKQSCWRWVRASVTVLYIQRQTNFCNTRL